MYHPRPSEGCSSWRRRRGCGRKLRRRWMRDHPNFVGHTDDSVVSMHDIEQSCRRGVMKVPRGGYHRESCHHTIVKQRL